MFRKRLQGAEYGLEPFISRLQRYEKKITWQGKSEEMQKNIKISSEVIFFLPMSKKKCIFAFWIYSTSMVYNIIRQTFEVIVSLLI